MTEVSIPSRAWEAVADAVTATDSRDAAAAGGFAVTSLVERGVRVAAPFIVAAELRRLANELDVIRAEMREEDNRTVRSSGLGEGIRRLRARADEIEAV